MTGNEQEKSGPLGDEFATADVQRVVTMLRDRYEIQMVVQEMERIVAAYE